MNTRVLLSVYGGLLSLGGLIWLLLPSQSLQIYGVTTPGPIALVLARYAGATGLGLGVMAWLLRGASASPARHSMLLALTLANTLSAAVCLHATLTTDLNVLAWGPVVAYAVFAVLCGIALRAHKPEAAPVSM